MTYLTDGSRTIAIEMYIGNNGIDYAADFFGVSLREYGFIKGSLFIVFVKSMTAFLMLNIGNRTGPRMRSEAFLTETLVFWIKEGVSPPFVN